MIARIPPQLRAIAASVAAVAGVELAPDAQPIIVALWLCGALADWALLRAPDENANGVPDWIEQRAPGIGALLVKAAAAGLLHDVKQYIRLRLSHTDEPREPLRRLDMGTGPHTAVGAVLLALLLSGCPAPDTYCGPPEPGMVWCDIHVERDDEFNMIETWITCGDETHVAYSRDGESR